MTSGPFLSNGPDDRQDKGTWTAGRPLSVPPATAATVTLCQHHEAPTLGHWGANDRFLLGPAMTWCRTRSRWCQMCSPRAQFVLQIPSVEGTVCVPSFTSTFPRTRTRKLTSKNTPSLPNIPSRSKGDLSLPSFALPPTRSTYSVFTWVLEPPASDLQGCR